MADTEIVNTEIIEINDIREITHFKGVSFSQFRKTDVIKELIKSLLDGKVESACYWSAELICSGHFLDLWDTIILFFSKYIHLGNPKLVNYIELRFTQFKHILKNGYLEQELKLRDNIKIRKLFAEIIIIFHYSKKKHPLTEIKIQSTHLDALHSQYKYKAPTLSYINEYLLEEDLKDLIIPLNEFSFNLSLHGKNGLDACYWIEWLIQFEKKCIAQHINILGRRNFPDIPSKFQTDMVFCVWSIILGEAKVRSELIKRMVESSFTLFCLKYSAGSFKKRKYLIYFSVELLTSEISNIPIVEDKSKIEQLLSNLNIIYKQIKKKEVSPGTDYLFTNIKNNNLEKTIVKLDTMNDFQTKFTPRL